MNPGRARKERIVSPLGLGVVAAAFAAAFIGFSPSRDAFTLAVAPDQSAADGQAAPDNLQLAYLRARAAGGSLSDAEARTAVLSLARSGRLSDARTLLASLPGLVFTAGQRYQLDLELAAGELRRAIDPDAVMAARQELTRLIAALPEREALQEPSLLHRALSLSALLGDAPLRAGLQRSLAAAEPARAGYWLAGCGRTLANAGQHQDALGCLERASPLMSSDAERFAVDLERLALSGSDLPARTLALSLIAEGQHSAAARESLAEVLLAGEMPGLAAQVYGQLARQVPEGRVLYLPLAARWSEAAGRPAEAAAWLDLMSDAEVGDDIAAHRRRIERLLVAAGKTEAALQRVALRLEQTPSDAQLTAEAVAMAQAAGEVAQALAWNTRYLASGADELPALDRQVDLALATGNPLLARRWAETALTRAPEDVPRRERLAQLAEWTADPEAALRERQRVAQAGGSTGNLRDVARLAAAVRRPEIAADARLELARRTAPDARALAQLVDQFELDGRPDAAATAIEEIIGIHGESADRLRALASLHERHYERRKALSAWERLARHAGAGDEETLARIELHWRLGEPDAALALARSLARRAFAGQASDYQASLLAELGWRYRDAAVSALARPLVAGLSDEDQRVRQSLRSIDALQTAGRKDQALLEAEAAWRANDDAEFALVALRLALETGDDAALRRLLAATAADKSASDSAAWWSIRAAAALRNGESAQARTAFEQALLLAPLDVEANGGLLWLAIGDNDTDLLNTLLRKRLPTFDHVPSLWPAIAVAHVALGDAAGSLPWFERSVESVGSDYGLVLSWADALEQAGEVDRALSVRAWALGELRPKLVAGVAGNEEQLLQQYGRLLARLGSADDNEAWMSFVLSTDLAGDDDARIWREDMAIAWLMATERHDHARVIMARRHDQRLATPRWQDLALALRTDDQQAIDAMLASGTGLSAGGRMLALRRVGRDAEAFALALRTLDAPASVEDLAIAQQQYVQMRRFRPSHVTARHAAVQRGELSIAQSGVSLRHAPGVDGFGLALDVSSKRYDSDALVTFVADGRRNLELELFRRDARSDLAFMAGIDADDAHELVYLGADWALRDRQARRELSIAVGLNEPADESAELLLAGKRDRVDLGLESAIGDSAFARLGLRASELSGRIDEQQLARGLRSQAEVGLRGALGSIAWSTSVTAENTQNDRADRLPAEFALSRASTLDSVIAAERTSLTLNGSISRGGVGTDFPDVASPRFYLIGGLGHAWPEETFGLQLDAGAGVRVMGNDELGVSVSHGTRIGSADIASDGTNLGVQYRHHF